MNQKTEMNQRYIDENDFEKAKFFSSFFLSMSFVLLLFLVHFIQWSMQSDFARFGVFPREVKGLSGILTSPLIHSDLEHLLSNSFSLLILMFGLFYFYREASATAFTIIYLLSGLFVWLFGRHSYHIGASGIVYGLAAYIFFSGLFRRDRKSMALSLIVVFLYGGMVWGIFPIKPEISFESHLAGALVGVVLAFAFRKYDPPEKYDWEEEEEDDDLDYGDTPEKIDDTDKLFGDDPDDDRRLFK
jgi:membrane associated rhomboid family serine protease